MSPLAAPLPPPSSPALSGAWLGDLVEWLDASPVRADDPSPLLAWLATSLGARSAGCWTGDADAVDWPLTGTWHDGQGGDAAWPCRLSRREAGMVPPRAGLAIPLACAGRTFGLIALRGDRRAARCDARTLVQAGCLIGQHLALAGSEARRVDAERRLVDTLEVAAVGIAHVDGSGRLLQVNRSLCELLDYERDALLGRSVREISHPDDIRVTDGVRRRLHSGEISSFQAEKRYLRRDGTPVWVQLTISVQRDAAGQPLYDIAIIQDISPRKRAEQALRISEQRFRSLVEMSSDWYWETDAELRFTAIGSRGQGQRLVHALTGRQPWEIPGVRASTDWVGLRQRLQDRQSLRDFEYSFTDRRGRRRHVSVNGEPMEDADGAFAGYRGVSRDITPRKAYEERVHYLATHDALTGLPNRAMFSELLNHLIDQAAPESRIAVLFIDLDRFKRINDTLGHDAGDQLLRVLATRLQDGLRSCDVVARLGGDEFVMLLKDPRSPAQAGRVARKALDVLTAPVRLRDADYRVTASIGISMFPDDARCESELMTHADVAMYHAKAQGRNNVQLYDRSLGHRSAEQLAMESRLRLAVEQQAFTLHYQPRLDLATGRITGVEALLRWTDAELGPVSPGDFIPVAEDNGLIVAIGRQVLRRACVQAKAWRRAGLPPIGMAVNLSARQLAAPGLLVDISRALSRSGLPPELLELEVTESAVMQDLARSLDVLEQLKRMGVRLAVDDFGTGHSSLAQLKRLPIDTLKIDRAFVHGLPDDIEDRAIAEAVLALGRSLDLTVVAEGVETQAQQDFLAGLGCQQIQGFHFSRPLPADDCATLLRANLGA